MDYERTHWLFAQGKKRWNRWATTMLKIKEAYQKNGMWEEKQSKWKNKAKAHFSSWFRKHIFNNRVDFKDIIFPSDVWFKDAVFKGKVFFDHVIFKHSVFFSSAIFNEEVWFNLANFKDKVEFGSCIFNSKTNFKSAIFEERVEFSSAKFKGFANFSNVTFSLNVNFNGCTFTEGVEFFGATFNDDVEFTGFVKFLSRVNFSHTTFNKRAKFEATFEDNVYFSDAKLKEFANFHGCIFCAETLFNSTHFGGGAIFKGSRFYQSVSLSNATFTEAVYFAKTTFMSHLVLKNSIFKHKVDFYGAHFKSAANFYAIQVQSSFSLDNAIFETEAPNFIQAHFLEAPRLDNVVMPSLAVMKKRAKEEQEAVEISEDKEDEKEDEKEKHSQTAATEMAKWRELQRMADMRHDHQRKIDFFAREIVSARFHPSTARWEKVIGWLYEHLSDFGRSFIRPFVGLILGVVIACSLMLSLSPEMVTRAQKLAVASNAPVFATFPWLAVEQFSSSCSTWTSAPDKDTDPKRDTRPTYTTGLSPEVAHRTSIGWEAFSLALRNAFVIGDWGSEVAHRTYGCLYGLERFGDTLAPIVPPWVSFISAVQKLWSAVMLFLLGLAFRNMLKMH